MVLRLGTRVGIGLAALPALVADATPVLRIDLHDVGIQATNTSGVNTPFGGLTHTGRLRFMLGNASVAGVFLQTTMGGPFVNAGFSGFSVAQMGGEFQVINGLATGTVGSMPLLSVTLDNADRYQCRVLFGGHIVESGTGGFAFSGTTDLGAFNADHFGNINVSAWRAPGVEPSGPFHILDWHPDASGFGLADIDFYIDVIPLPPAVWIGAVGLGMAAIAAAKRRRDL